MPKQTLRERLKHAWNAFANRDPTDEPKVSYGFNTYTRPDRPRLSFGRDKSIITSTKDYEKHWKSKYIL